MEQACFSGTQIAQSASWQNANVSTVLKNGQIMLSPPFTGRISTKQQGFLPETTGIFKRSHDENFAMVTDPRRPNEKPAVKKDESVNLNVYNIKAFSNHFEQIGYGLPSTIMASANWKVAKTKTKEWYLGAWGMADLKRFEQSRVGIMLTRM